MDNMLSGLIGAIIGSTLGVLGAGVIQWRQYRKKTLIQLKIDAGKEMTSVAKKLIYEVAENITEHEQFDRIPEDNKRLFVLDKLHSNLNHCLSVSAELVALQAIYSPLIDVKKEKVDDIFNKLDFYFEEVIKDINIQDSSKMQALSQTIDYVRWSTVVLVYEIQEKMYTGLMKKTRIRKRQNGKS